MSKANHEFDLSYKSLKPIQSFDTLSGSSENSKTLFFSKKTLSGPNPTFPSTCNGQNMGPSSSWAKPDQATISLFLPRPIPTTSCQPHLPIHVKKQEDGLHLPMAAPYSSRIFLSIPTPKIECPRQPKPILDLYSSPGHLRSNWR